MPQPSAQPVGLVANTLTVRPGLDYEAFRLRSQGATAESIGAALDLPPFLVERLIRHAAAKQKLNRSSRRIAERAVQLARLEELYATLRTPALDGDLKAVQRILEVLSRQASLLGLDAPREEIVTVKDGAFEQFVDKLKESRHPTITAECVPLNALPSADTGKI